MTIDGTEGTSFAVWAPNAVSVSVVGDFNGWDGRGHLMHRRPMSGILNFYSRSKKEIFISMRSESGEVRRF